MNILTDRHRRLARAGIAALLVGLSATGGAAVAGEVVAPRQKIVALAFDADSHTLIKAHPKELYRSRNEGRDWEAMALPAAVAHGRISAVSIAAKSSEVLYVAGPGFGLLRSADGGKGWTAKNAGLPSKEVIAMTAHADQPNTLYVALAGRKLFRRFVALSRSFVPSRICTQRG